MIQGDNYSWEGVLHFLHKQHETHSQQENIWFLEKKGLNEQIKQLEARVNALQNINNDLVNRNKMLEYCLRKMKQMSSKLEVKNQIEKNQIEELPKIPERRPKPNKNHINKILQSLGIRNLIQNIQKDLQMKGQPNLKIDQKIGTARQKDKSVVPMKSTVYKQTHTLTGHQDGVRDILFYDEKNFIISASQDCTLRIWQFKQNSTPQCLGAVREHSGPIFTVIQAEKYIFTGGMQGIIRGWDFRNVNQKKDIGKKNLVASWNNNEQEKLQPIWQLLYFPQKKMLFSTSSQCSIKGYSLTLEEGNINSTFKNSYAFQPAGFSNQEQDIPTSICIHNGQLVSGYVNNHSLVHFDIQTGKVTQELKFPATGQFSTNKVVSHPNLLIAAYEDRMVRLFDNTKMTYSFKAHDDSVMSIALTSNMNQFFTCGHDGYVKLWDLRKIQPISSFNAHSKKYDQSVHCVAASSKFKAASGGADSIIKVYESNA